jgi:O-acetyl-ADP-ribose deacetylase (regulator of RNase III)
MLNIILADIEAGLVKSWKQVCGDLPNVSVHHGSIFDVECDAVVSPANSFGFMDGGIDLQYSYFFGWHVQERLQNLIMRNHAGELLVGQAEIVPTDHAKIPYVISAPTMRVPMILGHETVNAYLATRAALLLIQYGTLANGTPIPEVVKTAAFPGMGTGVGQIPYAICARQMRQAIEDVAIQKPLFPNNWKMAQARHQALYSDHTRDLQYPE